MYQVGDSVLVDGGRTGIVSAMTLSSVTVTLNDGQGPASRILVRQRDYDRRLEKLAQHDHQDS
jgi:preprotein translocase subunit YajC